MTGGLGVLMNLNDVNIEQGTVVTILDAPTLRGLGQLR